MFACSAVKGHQKMISLFPDTHPKMEALQIRLWRQASPTLKMNMLAQLNKSAQILALAGLRSQFPQASESEIRRRLAGLLLGEETAGKVYGDINNAK
jgi:predicted component of type VI protein secretion system